MYTGLHNHTMYSNLRLKDSIIKPKQLILRAFELGFKGIAITEHECLSSHVDCQIAYEQLIKENKIPNDFKLILGNEIYLTPDLENKGEYYHCILLAKNETGHRLLRELSTRAWKNSYSYKGLERVPITFEQVEDIIGDNTGNLVCTTACIGSYLGKKIIKWKELESTNQDVNNIKGEIHNYLMWSKNLFKDDFYLEVQPSDTFEQLQHNSTLKMLSKSYNIPLVFTTDAHYLKKEDRIFHEVFLKSQEGERELEDFYKTTYLMSYDEVKYYLNMTFEECEIDIMKNNTNLIADKCEYYSLFQPQIVPTCRFDLDSVQDFNETGYYKNIDRLLNSCDEDKYWIRYCLQTLKKENKFNNQYLKRLDIEAEQLYLISQKLNQSLSPYFILMQKIVDIAWKFSMVGIGRGSSVGWLSNYLLGITGIDPVKFNLSQWWRFAHESRPELAD